MKLISLIIISLSFCKAGAELSPMSVDQAQKLIANPPPEIAGTLANTPNEYSFHLFDSDIIRSPLQYDAESFYLANQNTVNYADQVMRQVLINDLKLRFSKYNRGQFEGEFKKALSHYQGYYEFDSLVHGTRPFLVRARGVSGGNFPIYEGSVYFDICPNFECEVNLRQKTAGVGKDTPLLYGKLVGWNTPEIEGVVIDTDNSDSITPDELMKALIRVLAQNASSSQKSFTVPNGELEPQVIRKANLTPSGLDIAQLAQKLMHSAVSFSQASADSFGISNPHKKRGLYGDNTQFMGPMKPYTTLQHHWDEAFGYFGASRNYSEYSDLEIRKGFSIDAYVSSDVLDKEDHLVFVTQTHKSLIDDEVDFSISLTAEKIFGLASNAAKRDMGANPGSEDFTGKIMSAMLKGRHLIQEKPEGYLKYAQAFSVIALSQWEKVIAATVIHYINETLGDSERYGSEDYFASLAKHFSEMKGFAFAFQFNPNSQMNIEDFTEMHRLMGDHPAIPATGDALTYEKNLIKARSLIENSFGFDSENVVNW